MSQVAINSIAIFLFSITCLILLGPFVHIPAGVPVVLVLGVLTLGTADLFGFQGKGTNIFVDWFAQRSPEYRDRIAHHEAGHFLVAHLLGIAVEGYTLTALEALRAGYSGVAGVQFEPVRFSADELDRVKDYCTISIAGRVAEKLKFDSVEGGLTDLAWL
ncbi:MAG: ATP-dependent Zn protease, partial [Cyanobacteria bacterium P01_F01_bin.42]